MKLEKGMYVRTTYGIGKITDINIIYSDDGSFWYISCLTDMYIKNLGYIEIGLYAKKETYGVNGNFLRVYEPNDKYNLFEEYYKSPNKEKDNYLRERGIRYVCYINYGKERKIRGNSGLYDDHKFIKAKFNPIDLIKVGDYVNGKKAIDIWEEPFGEFAGQTFIKLEGEKSVPTLREVKAILTKEQFENNCYKIGDE